MIPQPITISKEINPQVQAFTIAPSGGWGRGGSATPNLFSYLSMFNSSLPPGVIHRSSSPAIGTYMTKLDRMADLKDGWNSYAAPRPHERAIGAAKSFVQAMGSLDYPPKRVAPSAVGGVAVSRRVGALNAFVEFYNDGRIFVMLSDGVGEPEIREVQPSLDSFKAVIGEMRTFLHE